MPRHPISDAHEWINEILTVPSHYLVNPQPRERAWMNKRGKKTLLSLTLVCLVERLEGCSIRGSESTFEIPRPSLLLYLLMCSGVSRRFSTKRSLMIDRL